MKKHLIAIVLIPQLLFSQNGITIKSNSDDNAFILAGVDQIASIYHDPLDAELIKKTAQLFAQDIGLVTGKSVKIFTSTNNLKGNVVIIGTLGKSRIIDSLAMKHKEFNQIKGQWERYIVKTISNPLPGIEKALIIAGSDRRGTAYGVFSVSQAIGVSPWYWWADVPVKKQDKLYIATDTYISKAPTVKYRGIFLNDEDWGLKPWAAKHIDPELNDIGPRTYAKIFELMLRLKANYLWPAMHECTGAFNKYEENKLVADTFGIIMGSAHCEPLLFNNATEWDKNSMGEWNYKSNKSQIIKQLDKRVESNAPFENIYTLALRGMHDEKMLGNLSQQEQVDILENAIKDQRELLEKYVEKDLEDIPQAFIPYKEVMDIYEMGLKVPDEVTLVWPDDNYGYIKRLSTPEEQKRSGGSGVYYHVSYLGVPHNNLWMSTTPPGLMYEEMAKAYRTGANRIWILNVGDIKACEYSTQLFLDMAWDINAFSYTMLSTHHANWYAQIFGDQYLKDLGTIWDNFYHQAFIRKPEFMGFGYEWNNDENPVEEIVNTKFSFAHYGEAEKRLKVYNDMANRAANIMQHLDEGLKPAFYQLVYYPVKGADLMNKKMLTAHKNRIYAQQGRSKTNELAHLTKQYSDSLQLITDKYNALLNGKWDKMMSVKQGWVSSAHVLPPLDSIPLGSEPVLGIFPEGYEKIKANSLPYLALPTFNSYAPKEYFIDIVNKGKGNLKWKATTPDKWIILSRFSGETSHEQRINVSIDWNNKPVAENLFGEIEFVSGDYTEKVIVSTFQPNSVTPEKLKGLFVEQNGCISIPAADFHRTNGANNQKTIIIEGIGIENTAIQFGEPLRRDLDPLASSTASVEYDFFSFNSGWIRVYVYSLPVFPLNPLEEAEYSFKIDDGLTFNHTIGVKEHTDEWKENVLRNSAIKVSEVFLDKPGKHTLKLMGISQGMVIQKIIIDFGGLENSYLGPESSKIE